MLFLFRFPTSHTHLLVVTSFDPLRVFLFDEGLVRLAAEPYPGGASRPGVPSNAPPFPVMESVMGSVTTHCMIPPHPKKKLHCGLLCCSARNFVCLSTWEPPGLCSSTLCFSGGVIYSTPSRSVKGMPVERLHKRCMHLTNYSVAPAADTQQWSPHYKTFAPSRHHANTAKRKLFAARVF